MQLHRDVSFKKQKTQTFFVVFQNIEVLDLVAIS